MKTFKDTINDILSIFETGSVSSLSAYRTVTVLTDGAGISYGKHQATDGGGTLDEIVQHYIDRKGQYAQDLVPFLDELAINATAKLDPKHLPSWADKLMTLLSKAGADPIMQQVQDDVFDTLYWNPMMLQAKSAGVSLPLSLLALYDTAIQSGPGAIPQMRRGFVNLPPSRGGDEKAWTKAYIATRHAYLTNFVSSRTGSAKTAHEALVRRSSYRTLELTKLAQADKWDLSLPLTVRGRKIPGGQ